MDFNKISNIALFYYHLPPHITTTPYRVCSVSEFVYIRIT